MEGFSVLRKRKDSHPLASSSHDMTYESHHIRVTVWIFNSVLKGRSKYNETLREKLEKAKEGVVIFLSFICGVSTRKCSRALSPSPIPILTLEQRLHFYLRLTIIDQVIQWTNLNHDLFIWITLNCRAQISKFVPCSWVMRSRCGSRCGGRWMCWHNITLHAMYVTHAHTLALRDHMK